jgi:hypothetical protein
MKLTGDPRLVGAVTGAVEHFAQEAGLDDASQKQLMSAAEQACLEVFTQLESPEKAVEVSIDHHADRLEILIAHMTDQAPAIGLDSFISRGEDAGPAHGMLLMTLVDRVLYDSEGGKSRLRLVKYLHPGAKRVQ